MKRIRMATAVVVMLATAVPAIAVTLDEARQAALDHAGLTAGQVTFTEQKADFEDGLSVFDVEFFAQGAAYDYEIDAATGDVLAFDNDLTDGAEGEPVNAEQALAIALLQAGLTADEVRVNKTEPDHEDGRQVFEIEFRHGGMEYECEVDAATGRITGWDVDDD